MSKQGLLNLFILVLLIFSVALNSFAHTIPFSEKNTDKKEVKDATDKKEEVKAASGFDAVVPFAGVALEKDLYIISSFNYSPDLSILFSEEDNFRENKFFKALICFFIAKKGP